MTGLQCTDCRATVRPVVAVDIDGTIGDYHRHFQRFAEDYLGHPLGPNVEKCKRIAEELGVLAVYRPPYDYSEEFSDWLGLDKTTYRQIKLAYRQGGMKRSMPVDLGAQDLLDSLTGAGAEVWIATTRPWLRLDNVDPDTRHWLSRHRLGYDHMIYGEDKYHQLVAAVGGERVVGVLDDLPEQVQAATALGIAAVHRVRNHAPHTVHAPAAYTLQQAETTLTERVLEWTKSQMTSSN